LAAACSNMRPNCPPPRMPIFFSLKIFFFND
jgi:hypothetical protein